MNIHSTMRVTTERGADYVSAAVEPLEARSQTRPDFGLRVQRTSDGATLDFGWARCVLEVDAAGLAVRAEADTPKALDQVCELMTRHLESHGDLPLDATWSHAPADAGRSERRDRMRGFHARMSRRHTGHGTDT